MYSRVDSLVIEIVLPEFHGVCSRNSENRENRKMADGVVTVVLIDV